MLLWNYGQHPSADAIKLSHRDTEGRAPASPLVKLVLLLIYLVQVADITNVINTQRKAPPALRTGTCSHVTRAVSRRASNVLVLFPAAQHESCDPTFVPPFLDFPIDDAPFLLSLSLLAPVSRLIYKPCFTCTFYCNPLQNQRASDRPLGEGDTWSPGLQGAHFRGCQETCTHVNRWCLRITSQR